MWKRCFTRRWRISASIFWSAPGPGARTHSLPMPKFTAIGATTRQGLVSAPLRGRFGLVLRLDPYNVDELTGDREAVRAAADASRSRTARAEEIARRCRGTPRIANRLLRRVRDYAQVRADGHITQAVAQTALEPARCGPLRPGRDRSEDHDDDPGEVPRRPGWREHDRGSISEEAETIEEVYEPYLIQLGFLNRTPRGRVATELAYDYFKVKRKLRRMSNQVCFRKGSYRSRITSGHHLIRWPMPVMYITDI